MAASVIHDLDLYGEDTPQGEAIVHYDDDAIKNALTLWISSKRGDFIKDPEEGGILDKLLFKPMNDETASLLNFTIKTAIINEFEPEVQLTNLYVEPDYENRLWIINLEYINPFTKERQAVEVYTKDLSQKLSFEYEEVTYSDINLRNWVIIKKPDMGNTLLLYDTDRGMWKWGKYLLPNLTTEDPYFSEILEVINT